MEAKILMLVLLGPLAVITPNEMFPYAAMREYPLIPMLIRAVQQLAARVAELEAAQP